MSTDISEGRTPCLEEYTLVGEGPPSWSTASASTSSTSYSKFFMDSFPPSTARTPLTERTLPTPACALIAAMTEGTANRRPL
jgi:hypothetical protein